MAIALNSLALAVFAVAVYAPASRLEHGRGDDYWFVLHNATNSPEANSRILFEGGRFVGALISRWVFPYVDTVPELFHMRLAAIFALSLSGSMLSVMTLRLLAAPRSPILRILALLVGLLAVVTPAAPSAATWAVMALQLWALPLALCGGLVATLQTRVLGLRWEVGAGILVFLAAFTYQPLASACILPVYMWSALNWARRQPAQWRRPILITALLVASLTSNLAIVKLLHLAGSNRVGGHDVVESLWWFVAFLARTAAATVPTTVTSVGPSLLVLLLVLFSPVLLDRRFVALPAAVLAALLLASGSLALGDQVPTYRQVMAAQTMLWSGSLACLSVTIQTWPRPNRLAGRPLIAALAAAATTLAALSGMRAYTYLAKPNMIDWASAQCAMRHSRLTDESVVVLNPVSASENHTETSEYGEIGSNTGWVVPYMAWLAAKSVNQGHLSPRAEVAELSVVEPSSRAATGKHAVRFDKDDCRPLVQ